MITAKKISNDFWILKNGSIKVGEISTLNDNIELNIKGNKTIFKTLETLKKKTNIEFIDFNNVSRVNNDTLYGYPFTGNLYNAVWDLKLKLPLYTKKENSKSLFAAGYYMVKIKNKWREILSPKLIILQRNEYLGPYKTSPTHDTYQ